MMREAHAGDGGHALTMEDSRQPPDQEKQDSARGRCEHSPGVTSGQHSQGHDRTCGSYLQSTARTRDTASWGSIRAEPRPSKVKITSEIRKREKVNGNAGGLTPGEQEDRGGQGFSASFPQQPKPRSEADQGTDPHSFQREATSLSKGRGRGQARPGTSSPTPHHPEHCTGRATKCRGPRGLQGLRDQR